MTSKSDVRKLVEAETERLGFTMKLAGGKWLITNPANGRTGEIPLQAMGRGLDNYRTKIRSLLHDHPTKPPMVAATDPDTEKADSMPRDTWWSVDTLVDAARANGIRPYVSGGILHTPGPVDAKPYAEMLQVREAEVIAHLTNTAASTTTRQGEPDMPTIGESAHVTRSKPRNVAADAEALWELLREAAREQGDKQLTNGGVVGVQWCGALADIIKATCPDWDAVHEKEVRQYLNRTEHTRCHRPRATPPVWWVALKWNNGDLTVTKVTPKPGPAPRRATSAPTPAPAAAAPASPSPALTALRAFETTLREAERRAATAERERDQALAELDDAYEQRDRALNERDKATAELKKATQESGPLRAQLEQAQAELAAINDLFTRLTGGGAS
ncbi:coiled-coil domain-containing protein (plasmid) [Microtetraspora malaysiensis]|uniref:coiled-coil domain-containing protein n=1 Tax=Microtetraspora malaysiensis TaxID=161358 RepID=UPI003D90E559